MSPAPATAATATALAGLPAGYGDDYRVVSHRGVAIAPRVLEQLERLDDALFAALAGDEAALREFSRLWDEAAESAPTELLEDSRKHYVRHARARSRHAVAEQLLDVLEEPTAAA